ncbi:2,5-didehydrogluconate reductase DkgB [Marinobacter sp. X15-166B]|uniref:2,5-didehydrogluconate reductase DkgB n=1 Tax=Marinobacter sp. X15-166B TaxID=1897620 RepID=UPI00085CB645|nr:2,5-didehydrogluconate reductase DkgB [Marinobacter sp. X15-166B]OEY66936.1 2,5-didehydrogluconate reductase B [Marinobacter sp. X15-166B]
MSFDTLPSIGLGTFRLQGDTAREAVRNALSVGYRHIDTAQFYANESAVGDGITSSGIPRREIFLTTKVWHENLHPSDLMNSLKGSLQRLKTDHVDLALIHWPSPDDQVPMEVYLHALRDAQREGLTEHIGVSNFTCTQLTQAQHILGDAAIFTHQVESHPFFANRKVVELTQKLGIQVTGYMPLAAGRVMEDTTLQQIGRDYNASPAQIALAWLLARQIVPIPASTRPQHQKANLDALQLSLSAEDLHAIDRLDRGERLADPSFAPDWD